VLTDGYRDGAERAAEPRVWAGRTSALDCRPTATGARLRSRTGIRVCPSRGARGPKARPHPRGEGVPLPSPRLVRRLLDNEKRLAVRRRLVSIGRRNRTCDRAAAQSDRRHRPRRRSPPRLCCRSARRSPALRSPPSSHGCSPGSSEAPPYSASSPACCPHGSRCARGPPTRSDSRTSQIAALDKARHGHRPRGDWCNAHGQASALRACLSHEGVARPTPSHTLATDDDQSAGNTPASWQRSSPGAPLGSPARY
jgi:hypothetical protein